MANTTNEILALVEREVNVKRLVDKLSFDLENFEQANLEQPKLYLEAGRYRTWAVLEKGRAEVRLETGMAKYGLELRERKSDRGLTEKAIAEMVASSKDIVKLKQRVYMAKATDEWARQLLEAYNQRLEVLKNITKIRSGEMATELRSVKEKAAVDTMRRTQERARRELED
jgi:hypothetical protein